MGAHWFGRVLDAIRARFSAPEQGMDEEMRFHLEMATQRNIERGMAPDEARRRALATFGGLSHHREAALDESPGRWIDDARQDFRYAVRALRRNPSFALAIVLTLALGIGANTAIFSVVNGVLLRPLPVPNPEQIVVVTWDWGGGKSATSLTAFQLEYLRRHARTFSGLTTYRTAERDLGDTPPFRPARVARVTPDFFEVIGVPPALGRGFTPDEYESGAPPVAVLSDALWRAAFNADPGVLGRELRLDGTVYTVVGVTPSTFRVLGLISENSEVIVPLRLQADPKDQAHNYMVMGRVRGDRAREQVQADLDAVAASFSREHPDLATSRERFLLREFQDIYVGPVKRTLLVLFAAVTFVLLIAVANAANLLLARATAREREIVVRTALGARRSRIVRQLISEGLVLSAIAGTLGLALGMWGVKAMLALTPDRLPRMDEIGVDVRVLAFTLGVVVVTGLGFGLAAALPTARLGLSSALGDRSRSSGASRRSRDLLVLSETAFAIVLLAGAGLLIASFAKLRSVDPGFDPENVTAIRFGRMPEGYDKASAVWELERQLVERLTQLPGVESVAGLSNFPLERGMNMAVAATDAPEVSHGDIEWRAITPGYFRTLDIALLRGRDFAATDRRDAPRVAIINASMAERYFPGEDPIGRRIDIGRYKGTWVSPEFEGTVAEVVGVAADIREIQLQRDAKRTVYVPTTQAQDGMIDGPALVIRSTQPAALRAAVDAAVRAIDPRITAPRLEPMPGIVGASIAEQRFQTTLLTLFASTALALTAIGIFGVVAYGVQQRVREIGVRVALGATSRDVLRLIVGRSIVFVSSGALIGLIAALGLTRFMSGLLYGVTATDPLALSLAVATLLTVAVAASYLPARRAARIDPVRALRLE